MKPECLPSRHVPWVERELPRLALAKPEVAAPVLDRHVRWMESRDKARYVEWGLCVMMVEDRELWKCLADEDGNAYRGFEHWLMAAAPTSRATAYEAMRSMRELKCVPLDELRQMPRMNIKVLRQLPGKRKSDPEILAAAKTQSERQFRATIRERVPEALIEAIQPMSLKTEASQREVIDLAIEAAGYIFHTASREQAIESIAVAWLDSPCGEEGCENMTCREFFEARTLTAKARMANA